MVRELHVVLGEELSEPEQICAPGFAKAAFPASFHSDPANSACAHDAATASDAAGHGTCDATGSPTGSRHALGCSLPHVHGHGHAAYGHVDPGKNYEGCLEAQFWIFW